MNAYTIEERMYDDVWFPKFAFHAKDEKDAENKRFGWLRYHGLNNNDVRIRPSTENEAANWIHNEWVS